MNFEEETIQHITGQMLDKCWTYHGQIKKSIFRRQNQQVMGWPWLEQERELVKSDSCLSAFLCGKTVVSFVKTEATGPGLGRRIISLV